MLTHAQLPFYIELMHQLAERGIPVPQPQTLRDGTRLTTLHGKPCAIVTRLPGGYEPAPGAAHCAGRRHARPHPPGRPGLPDTPAQSARPVLVAGNRPKVMPFLDEGQARLLSTELAEQQAASATASWQSLPSGPAHCDLFRDNVLFAGTFDDPFDGRFHRLLFRGLRYLAVRRGGQRQRLVHRAGHRRVYSRAGAILAASLCRGAAFTDAERQAWPLMLRGAALRFWLSRLYDYFLPRPAQTLKPHDPRHFERVLQARHLPGLPELP